MAKYSEPIFLLSNNFQKFESTPLRLIVFERLVLSGVLKVPEKRSEEDQMFLLSLS